MADIKIDTIMFDLDGTLLQYSQEAFIKAYFSKIKNVFIRLGMDADIAVKGIWAGTKAMVENDGTVFNARRFWDAFSGYYGIKGERLKVVEAACDDFYRVDFNAVKTIMKPCDISAKIVHMMAEKGYTIVLATNPLFPLCAVQSRLGWIGLKPQDFKLITHYENSTFCKPNLDYYKEIFSKIGKLPQQCIMVGNNPVEDMCAGDLGAKTYLITDFIENEFSMDITGFDRGTIEDIEIYLMAMPDVCHQ